MYVDGAGNWANVLGAANAFVLGHNPDGAPTWQSGDQFPYTPAVGANWNGAAPVAVWAAMDRLAAWMLANFPLLTPP
jgi:hypothetical protein